MENFTVISSNPSTKGGFITKLQCKTVVETPLFGTKEKSETYYVKGSKQLKVAEIVALDVSHWRVEEYPFTPPDVMDESTGELVKQKTIMLKYLHLK